MRFTMKRACLDCPFRRSKRFPLRRERMLEIVDSVRDGSVFPCHKTTTNAYSHQRVCAGWLLYQKRHRRSNQQMQVMERLGLYKPRRLVDDGDMITLRHEIEEAPWFKE